MTVPEARRCIQSPLAAPEPLPLGVIRDAAVIHGARGRAKTRNGK